MTIVHGYHEGVVHYESLSGDRGAIALVDHSAIAHAMDAGELRELDPCDQCKDAPGTEDMGGGRMFCPPCCSRAGGEHQDRGDGL